MKTKTIILSLALALMAQITTAQHFGWAKQLGGTNDEYAYSIAIDAAGNLYSIGAFQGTTDFDPGAGTFNLTSANDYDIYLSKLDASGNFVWAKQLGGTGSDWGIAISIDALGNIYTTGIFEGTADFDPGPGTVNLTSTGGRSLFISKLDASGNFVWAKQTRGNAEGNFIRTDASGNVYTSGNFQGTTDFDPGAGTVNLTSAGGRDAFVCKLDASGNFVWAKHLGGSGDDVSESLAIDASGNCLITGYFSNKADFDPAPGTTSFLTAVAGDIYITKLDASGNFVWAKQLGGSGLDWGNSIVLDASGNIYTTGFFQKTADFDPGVGTANLTAAAESSGIFVSKLNASGDFVWAKKLGGTGSDGGNAIALDASGNVYTTGSFTQTADFDPGAGTVNLTSAGAGDVFISKLDASGNFVWATQLGGTLYDLAKYLAVDASGNVYTTGTFGSTVDFDPGSNTFNLTTVGGIDAFVHKLSQTNTGLTKNSLEHEILLYPNPSNGQLQIVFSKELNNAEVTVRNVLGLEISSESYTSANSINLALEGCSGMYFIEISSQGKKATYKIVKE